MNFLSVILPLCLDVISINNPTTLLFEIFRLSMPVSCLYLSFNLSICTRPLLIKSCNSLILGWKVGFITSPSLMILGASSLIDSLIKSVVSEFPSNGATNFSMFSGKLKPLFTTKLPLISSAIRIVSLMLSKSFGEPLCI